MSGDAWPIACHESEEPRALQRSADGADLYRVCCLVTHTYSLDHCSLAVHPLAKVCDRSTFAGHPLDCIQPPWTPDKSPRSTMLTLVGLKWVAVGLLGSVAAMASDSAGFSTKADYSQPIVIAGGGPAGLSTALMLAKRGFRDITVLEAMSAKNYLKDTDRSYRMGLHPRSQWVLESLGAADAVKADASLDIGKNATIVRPEGVTVRRIFRDPTDKRGASKGDGKSRKRTYNDYWLVTRQTLVRGLFRTVRRKYPRCIRVIFDAKVDSVRITERQSRPVEVTFTKPSRVPFWRSPVMTIRQLNASLVLGTDGYRSKVLDAMKELNPDFKEVVLSQCPRLPAKESRRRYKVLSFPGNVTFCFSPRSQGNSSAPPQRYQLHHDTLGLFYSAKDNVRMSLFQAPRKTSLRPGVIAVDKSHKLLSLKTCDAVLEYFGEVFPHLRPIRVFISREEADRFAKSRPGTLSLPRYVWPLHYGDRLVLLGDSAHSVPPNMGLGVNAALDDCRALKEALDKAGDDLAMALPLYSELQGKEAQSLALLEYRHSLTPASAMFRQLTPLQRLDWHVEKRLRSMLRKLLPWLFSTEFETIPLRTAYGGSLTKVLREADALANTARAAKLALVATIVLAGVREAIRRGLVEVVWST
ncbi:unnamed protein product [Vitrella brassicaformis CCMP3155]|uniref:FAD-binding domain-containing protein n=2 Tax=Vitrella brassicaformis TaxID=1169539 RepID=A0A0G4G0Y0_VITBC|nr:unnamed protein product [Vitrella brassicaformis CCMP3155]|eukprot:CEM21288.1 unnamed protein product [Vitrella brassicaformis CCMP3155]